MRFSFIVGVSSSPPGAQSLSSSLNFLICSTRESFSFASSTPAWAAKQGIEDASLESLAGDERVVAAVQEGVDAANEKLARVEQIKKFTVVPGDWAPGGDELTPTMKLKRKPIAEKYADAIEAMYAG